MTTTAVMMRRVMMVRVMMRRGMMVSLQGEFQPSISPHSQLHPDPTIASRAPKRVQNVYAVKHLSAGRRVGTHVHGCVDFVLSKGLAVPVVDFGFFG